MAYLTISLITFLIGLTIGSVVGDKTCYDRGCSDTNDYYHSKGVRM